MIWRTPVPSPATTQILNEPIFSEPDRVESKATKSPLALHRGLPTNGPSNLVSCRAVAGLSVSDSIGGDELFWRRPLLVLHERHQEHVVFAPDDEDALASVTAGVRVFQDVEQIAALDTARFASSPILAGGRPSSRAGCRGRLTADLSLPHSPRARRTWCC